MSEMLDMPMPSATSNMDPTSSGSNPGDTGLPRMTASGQFALSSLHPSNPPSRKSTNVLEPELPESLEKRAISLPILSDGVSLRYRCFRPSGGATSSSSDIPSGIVRP